MATDSSSGPPFEKACDEIGRIFSPQSIDLFATFIEKYPLDYEFTVPELLETMADSLRALKDG